MAEEMSRRERNKERTRRAIIWAATELFEKKGYEATTIDELAERADVSRGTFFNYFSSKQALLNAIAEQEVSDLSDILTSDLGELSSPLERLDRLVSAYSRDSLTYKNVSRLALQSVLSDPEEIPSAVQSFLHLVMVQIREAQAVGELDPELDPAEMVGAFMGIYAASLFWTFMAPEGASGHPEKRFWSLFDMLYKGIAGPSNKEKQG